ncbi:MAG: hypothetical protein OXU50_04490 [Gammaproteobacteria bacterium]|nr:hypothetical protein [Gammaproteobacteria bacterium]MDD9806666.1 hypothetical protein [Gammaproteobacteria bacterium]MDD9869133.1 hypothetical protein [Gammaproteobacteria bacterium]MDD9885825.1 hypothetical protein [Gammaproteobacteria bacterium]
MNDMIDDVHHLEKTGMTREQAEAAAKVIANTVARALEPMATKAEIVELQYRIVSNERHTILAIALSTAAIVAAIFLG